MHASRSRELTSRIRAKQYLVDCRPQSVAMGAAIKWIKTRIQMAPPGLGEGEIKEKLIEQAGWAAHVT